MNLNKFSDIVLAIRTSIKDGYLDPAWHKDKDNLVLTHQDRFALFKDVVEIESDYYHKEKDSDLICIDPGGNGEYCFKRDLVDVRVANGLSKFMNKHNSKVKFFCGEYYHIDSIEEYNIVQLHNGDLCWEDDARYVDYNRHTGWWPADEVYYWEALDQYRLEPDESQPRIMRPSDLWSYGGGPTEKNYLDIDHDPKSGVKFGFGMEIEKGRMPDFPFSKEVLYEDSGAVMERDSSVSDGFELKTPIYNLFSPKTEQRLALLKDYANVRNVDGAGGHIGFSMEGKTDEELIDLCTGWIPLIYSLYKKRITNSYCSGKSVDKLKSDKEKFQAISLRQHYIEFRIIASVKNFDSVMFRLKFFRIMAKNLGKSFSAVIGMAINPKTDLYKLLRSDMYKDSAKFERLIRNAIEINETFGKKK